MFKENTIFGMGITYYWLYLKHTEMIVGQKIKKIRELKNLTQDYVSEKLGISQSGYSKLENGEVDIPIERLRQISELMGLKPEDILSFDENMVFNIMYNKTGNGFVINHVSENEKRLYEEQIKTLKDEIIHLKSVLDKVLKT
jgi:transcriptional regulator with XRE-family HTH domain